METYDKIVKKDIDKTFENIKALKFWLTHNELPPKVLKQIFNQLSDMQEVIEDKLGYR